MAEILALDIGGTKIGWAVVRYLGAGGSDPKFDFEIVADGAIPTCALEGGSAVLARLNALAVEVHSAHPQISGVSIASAGVVDPNTGAIISATDTMPGWGGSLLGESIAQVTGLPVEVINDVHAHGLGEAKLGAGKESARVLSLAVGTGIGGALIDHGQIVFGNNFLAGHYGHVHHRYAVGMECSCGRTGHIEAISSGSGITAWYNARAQKIWIHCPIQL
ncbi:ROK family protein [Arcanobacterium hippocoleae]|uniref:ROK family protein n=1 Tax=Arcanobacterium hippocoleae TaxID=149017 RepID=UPI003342A34E